MKYLAIILLCTNGLAIVLKAQTISQTFGNTNSFVNVASPQGVQLRAQLTGGNYFQKTNLVNNNDVVLPSYTLNGEKISNTYFSNDWVKGSVTTTDNKTYSEGLVFMFDKVNRQLYFKKNDSASIMQADMSNVLLFSLVTDKQHIFLKGSLLNSNYHNEVFEILVLNEKKFSLLKSILTVYQKPADNTAAQALTQTIVTGKYVDNPVYYIYKDKELQQIQLKKKSLIKILSPDEFKTASYISEHHENFDEDYAINLLTYINEQ